MAITTYSDAPYFDDFDQDNKYLRILFRPGRSVQVRELNQLQSNVQDQIDKFGRHVFKDGDRVLDGYTTYDSSIRSIGVTWINSSTSLTAAELTALNGVEIYSGTAWRAKILGAVKVTDGTTGYRLYIKLIGQDASFTDGDDINLGGDEDNISLGGTSYSASAQIGDYVEAVETLSYHGGVFQDAGVFFVKGHFVHTDATSAFYEKTDSTTKLTGDAVFDIVESVVTSGTDSSLNDNANGEPNVNAPGADRYKISLNLSFVPSDDENVVQDQQRIKLLSIKEDKIVNPARTQYSELGKTLAERTEEESGSYVLNPFKYDVREYLNDEAGNRGRYTDDEIYNSGGDPLLPGVTDTTTAASEGAKRYVIGVEPGVAYVQGYRVELETKQDVVADKGRESSDTATKSDYKFSADRGQYIEGSFTHESGDLNGTDINAFLFDPDTEYKFFDANNSSTLVGTCRIHAIENTGIQTANGGETPTSAQATKRLYIYDVKLEADYTLSQAKVLMLNPGEDSPSGESAFSNSSGFELKEIGDNASRMVYPLGGLDVEEINVTGSSVIVQKRYVDSTSTTAGVAVITAASGDSFLSTDPEDYVIIQASAGTDTTAGETYVTKVSIVGQQATLTLKRADGTTPSAANSSNVRVLAPVSTPLVVRTKTKTGPTITYSGSTSLNPGDVLTLNKVDVYALNAATHNGNSLSISDFELITGQTDTHYGYSQVVYKGTESLKSATVQISAYYYAHGAGNVFAANSYTDDPEDIPTYEELRLSNCLDFRPSILDSSEGYGIKPNSVVSLDFDYYKPRKDIVVLNQLGDVQFIQGTPSDSPVYPQTPSDSLLLYKIEKPGYLYTLNDLKIERIDNRRYTMRDIGDLENRISKLEYYASLSQLESEAAETQLLDSTGNTRFKGGILTDSFRGHGVGDVRSSGYRTAIDRGNFTARPMYLSDTARWKYVSGMGTGGAVTTWNGDTIDSTTSYSGKRGNAVTLDFIERVLVDQPFASGHISVNPYDVATWSGNLEISPSSDEWKDINHVPDIINNVEGDNTALLEQIANDANILGTEWNEWESQWLPTGRRGRLSDQFSETTWTSRTRGIARTFQRQLREGIQTSLVENIEREVINDQLLNVTFVPFIRSRKIYFKGSMLKPNTTFYLYFDDVNITSYALDGVSFVQYGSSSDVERFEGLTTGFDSPDADGGIVTDSAGEVEGWFVIPNNDTLRFRTGSRQIRLTDNSSNNRVLELSSAETTYHAKGLLENRQQTILATRQLSIERTRVQESRNVQLNERVVRRDPVAQTFMIGNEPTGIFLSSVDIYFQKKDPNLPVELSIVAVENGIPTQKTLPFSRVTKLPADVNVDSTDGSDETKFMFDTPVYLQPGVEYAIVLVSNSARYRVWHAEVGGTDVGTNGEKINKNVNLGVLLKSQNASTWTPDQNKDLKFTLNRADFKTTETTAVFTGLCPSRGDVTYINVTDGGSGYLTGASVSVTGTATAKAYVGRGGVIDYIEVISGGSGYTAAPTVTIAAAEEINIPTSGVSGNNITIPSNLIEVQNGQKFTYNTNGGTAITGLSDGDVVLAVTVDSNGNEVDYSRTFTLTDTSNTPITLSGTGNAAQGLTPHTDTAASATAEINTWKASSYLPIIQDLLLPESSVNYTMNTSETSSYSVYPGEVLYTNERVTHDSSSSSSGTGADMLKLQAALSTTNSKISPVIDLDRISLVTFDNIVNNSSEFETSRNDGQCAARYITKSIKLSSPADQINVYFDAVRPDDSTDVEVYAKYKYLNSTDSFDSLSWTKIDSKNGTKVPVSTNFKFGEMRFEGTTGDQEFDQVAVKILFKSSNRVYVPEIKNLRVIASL